VGGGWALRRALVMVSAGVLYVSDGSLNSTPETDVTLYVKQNLNKNLKKKKKEVIDILITRGRDFKFVKAIEINLGYFFTYLLPQPRFHLEFLTN